MLEIKGLSYQVEGESGQELGILNDVSLTVEDYKLVVNGNYILFCITENADQAVEIFDDYTK